MDRGRNAGVGRWGRDWGLPHTLSLQAREKPREEVPLQVLPQRVYSETRREPEEPERLGVCWGGVGRGGASRAKQRAERLGR